MPLNGIDISLPSGPGIFIVDVISSIMNRPSSTHLVVEVPLDSVGGVPGQVVVVPGMMVPRPTAMIAERPDDGQMMGLFRQVRQMFAQLDPRSRGRQRLE